MILLDTNIISEMMKLEPQASVSDWLDQQGPDPLRISSISIAEIVYGTEILERGKRKAFLEQRFQGLFQRLFKSRALIFDSEAAFAYGKILAKRQALGKPMDILDGQIAAIASINKALLVTRNIKDFQDCGIEVFNPFSC